MKSNPWLKSQIDQAKQDVELWPEWMKRVASFDGANREALNAPKVSEPQDAEPKKKTA